MPPTTPYTTPLLPASSAILTIHAQRRIAAPAALVFSVLRNTETWKDWNDFVPRIAIRSQLEDGAAVGGGGEYGQATTTTTTPGSPHDRAASSASSTPDHPRRPSAKHRAATGDPSVRLKIGTAMTFHVRMNPDRPDKYTDANLFVTEVSRPGNVRHDLAKSETHTTPVLDKTDPAVYRISWASDPTLSFPATLPKWMLLAQRVHEVRPIVLGDGGGGGGSEEEECEVTTWECQSGLAARVVRAKYATYLQRKFDDGLKGLGEFVEAMGGKVDRRDFSIDDDALGYGMKADA